MDLSAALVAALLGTAGLSGLLGALSRELLSFLGDGRRAASDREQRDRIWSQVDRALAAERETNARERGALATRIKDLETQVDDQETRILGLTRDNERLTGEVAALRVENTELRQVLAEHEIPAPPRRRRTAAA